jgi:hypothetical protein
MFRAALQLDYPVPSRYLELSQQFGGKVMTLDAIELHQLRKIGSGDVVFLDPHTTCKLRVMGLVTGSDDRPQLTKTGWRYAASVGQSYSMKSSG